MELDYVKLKEIKPAIAGYIRESQAMLKISDVPDEKVVHDVRVLMKKSRASLKMAAPQLERESVERDLYSFRQVGRIMCSWRDTSVHRKTLKELRKENPDIFSQLEDNKNLSALMKKTIPAEEVPETVKNGLEQIDSLLNKTGYRLRFQSMNKIDPRLLIKELEQTYVSVVEIYLKSRYSLKQNDIHEFRKR
jgi:hypothetical protein